VIGFTNACLKILRTICSIKTIPTSTGRNQENCYKKHGELALILNPRHRPA
jgi:hypothetical protein